jgi:hypothetical protein
MAILNINHSAMRCALGLLVLASSGLAQLRITSTSVPVATQYQPYSTTLTATGGSTPYSWSVVTTTTTSLPEGMTLNSVTGVVTAAQVNGMGGYAVTIKVTDAASATATATLNFAVNSVSDYGGCQMFPVDNIYNQRVDQLPVDTNPAHQIPSSYLTGSLHPDFGTGFYPTPGGIPYLRVPANQPLINVNLANSGQTTPAGTYQWPFFSWPNQVIEGTSYGQAGDDHHILILQTSSNSISGPQTGPCILYETYQSDAVPSMFNGTTNTWMMLAGARYVLNSNAIASSVADLDNGAQDSPGIPMVPLLIHYSEVPMAVNHPLRITFPSPTNGWVWPGTGCCGGSGPPQGLLYRLKASVNWQATCPVSTNPQAATVLQALQQYGAYMSDHGSVGFITGAPDPRWSDDDLACIKRLHVSDLEVVDNSVLHISDISGQTKPYVVPATLPAAAVSSSYSATVSAVGGDPTNRRWSIAAGTLPGGLSLNASTGAITGSPVSSAGSPFQFSLVATDTISGYASGAQAFTLTVTGTATTVPITVSSNPAGRSVTVDGITFTTPAAFNWVPGSSHTLATTSPQGTGTRYSFASWSDGGAQSHSVTAPSSAGTYTASFTTQYLLTTSVSPTGSGTLTANPSSTDGYYNAGSSVQLTATASGTNRFSSFSGDLTGSTNPQNIAMSAPHTVTANFSAAPAALTISKTHAGNFTQGQNGAAYTITVSNPALAGPTVGTVTVTDTAPAGMTLALMSGTGWTCTGNTCSRTDSLAGGASYPAITATVNVSATAGSPLVNSASVSGGGSATATSNDSTTITAVIPPSGVSFIKVDTTTAGNWRGVYGTDGYNVIGNINNVPSYVTVTPTGNSTYVWATSTTDQRALQTADGTGRVAAAWYTLSTMTVDLAFHDSSNHQVALYVMNWDGLQRSERIDVLNASGTVVDTRSVSNFVNGQYLVWTMSGHVTLRITSTHPAHNSNALLEGLFFGGAGPVPLPATTAAAKFLKLDTTTAGSWQGIYGVDGYNVIAGGSSIPSYVTVTPTGNSSYVWTNSTQDTRALQLPPSGRIAGCWYSGYGFDIDLNFKDTVAHQVALYLLDWDNFYSRTERVEVLDTNGNVLDSQNVANFVGGQYLVWNLSGHVTLRVTNTNQPSNAVVSGLFFR